MTTKEAYKSLFEMPKIYLFLGVTSEYWRSHKYHVLKDNQWPSEDTMHARLEKVGFVVVREKNWKNFNETRKSPDTPGLSS